MVNTKQEAAFALYNRAGFAVAAEMKKELMIDGEY